MFFSDDGCSYSAENEEMRVAVKILTLMYLQIKAYNLTYPSHDMKNKIHLSVSCALVKKTKQVEQGVALRCSAKKLF